MTSLWNETMSNRSFEETLLYTVAIKKKHFRYESLTNVLVKKMWDHLGRREFEGKSSRMRYKTTIDIS